MQACERSAMPWSRRSKAFTCARGQKAVVRAILLTPTERATSKPTSSASLAPVQARKDLEVTTHFSFHAEDPEHVVEVWGSWNQWEQPVRMHCAGEGQPHRAIVPMPVGGVEYKYKVNQKDWRVSLKEDRVDSNAGHLNNFRVVQPTLEFFIRAPEAREVSVIGDWDGWQYSLPLEKDASGQWYSCTHLRPGQYCYQFIVDNRVTHNTAEEAGLYPGRGIVNRAWAVDQPIFRLFYCTGWEDVQLHFRRILPNGQREGTDFNVLRMVSASSCGNELGKWFMAPVVPLDPGESLEFYLSGKRPDNSQRAEDRPGGSKSGTTSSNASALYTLPRPGSFKLSWGNVRVFDRGAQPRYMLVSDIDGTMIGPQPPLGEARDTQYVSSKRFRTYWENGPALAGSILIYNTGRSLGHTTSMLKEAPQVAVPDAMIVAVGTKVYLNMEEVGRGRTSGQNWVEDLEYTYSLGGPQQGWDLDRVRGIARKLMDWGFKYNRGKPSDNPALKVNDDGSEHQHRYSFLAEQGIVEDLKAELKARFLREGLNVRIITSGHGSHKYVDCIPVAAGKEKALQYLRKKYDVPEHFCVAAGDSGNDILMLEGDHPSIVVGNAQPDLLDWLNNQPQDGKVILTDAFYADGIMEGLARHGLF